MKLIFSVASVLLCSVLLSQNITPAPKDKAVVYFVRASKLGSLINFTYFDSTKVIAKFSGYNYFRYECEPGNHLFWARSENKDFVRASLEAGKIYLIDVVPFMGALKATVELYPVNSSEYKPKKIKKLIAKREPLEFSEMELVEIQKSMDQSGVTNRGINKASNLGNDIYRLTGYSLTPDQFLFQN